MMLKILQVITGLNSGGAERMMQKVVLNTSTESIEHLVVSLTGGGVVGQELTDSGIAVIPLRFNLKGLLSGEWGRLGRACIKADVMSGWMYHANVIAFLLGFIYRKPVVWGVRRGRIDNQHDKFSTRLVYRLGAWLSGFVKAVIYCSNESLEYHCQDGYNKSNVIFVPNGINVKDFRKTDIPVETGLLPQRESTELRILLAGRWSPLKGHGLFLSTLAKLADSHSFQVILCGNDITSENTALMKLIEASGLMNKVVLLGRRSDLPQVMSSCEVLVSASFVEAFPNTIAEAMACEMYCVVTDVGESREIVGDCGIVVPPNDIEALVRGLRTALELDPEERKRIGQAARQRIISRYDIGTIAKRYEQIYQDVSGRK